MSDEKRETGGWTPGPWEIVRTISGKEPWYMRGEQCFLEHHYLVEGKTIAFARVSGETQAEALANARLIAAAPELVEALERERARVRALEAALTELRNVAAAVSHLQHAGIAIPADAWAELYDGVEKARAALNARREAYGVRVRTESERGGGEA